MSRIGQDYIWAHQRTRDHGIVRWLGLALAIVLAATAIFIGARHPSPAPAQSTALRQTAVPLKSAASTPKASGVQLVNFTLRNTASAPREARKTTVVTPRWIGVTIQRGDTLSLAFERHDLSYRDSLAITHLEHYGARFKRGLHAGDKLRVRATRKGRVLALDYPLGPLKTLQVRSSPNGYNAQVLAADVDHRTAYAAGTITNNFYVDALQTGLSDKTIMRLAHLFGWDIDFVNDVRPGDRFVVVYDQLFRAGQKIADGHILAAEFVNDGRDLRAFRYTDGQGHSAYYSATGQAIKKAFLRIPLDQFRVSSQFSLGRLHPILNTIRKHEGTDYAAPTGTPIESTSDGRIAFRGRMGGYGNMVIVRYDSHYATRYGHMSRFARGQHVGSHVRQGQVIGYVGMTGLATGPHCHYEFRVNGKARNPQTVKLPHAPPLPKKYMTEFRRQIHPLVAQLDRLDGVEVANNDSYK